MSDPFKDPAGPVGLNFKELNGSLLLFSPIKLHPAVVTDYGVSDAVESDVVVLDGPNRGDEYKGAYVFPKVLVRDLKNELGGKILGRLGQGESTKAGHTAPWVLKVPTEEDKVIARKYIAYVETQTVAAAPEPVAAANTPW